MLAAWDPSPEYNPTSASSVELSISVVESVQGEEPMLSVAILDVPPSDVIIDDPMDDIVGSMLLASVVSPEVLGF